MNYTVHIYLRGKPTIREYLLKWYFLSVNRCWPNPVLPGIIQCSFTEANGPLCWVILERNRVFYVWF